MVWANCVLTVAATPHLNVRTAPNTSAEIATTLKPGVYDGQCAGEQVVGDYNWLHWRSNEAGGPEGWVALRNVKTGTVLATVADAPVPDPDPEPEPEPAPEPVPSGGTLTQEQALALMDSFVQMGDRLLESLNLAIAAVQQWQGLCIETRDEIASNLKSAPPEQEARHEEKAA